MADVLSHPSSIPAFDMSSSPLESPIEVNEPPFVDASEHPAIPTPPEEKEQPAYNPFPWTQPMASSSLQTPNEDSAGGFRHRKHKSLALPQFSFNPGASLDTSSKNFSPPTSPKSPDAQSSPSRGRHGHRRVITELAGGDSRHQSPITSTVPPVDRLNEELAAAVPNRPPSSGKGHKHRRSAAVSKDLTGIVGRPGSAGSRPAPSPTFGAHFLPPVTEPTRSTKSSSPTRVSFAESVDVIPPRKSLPTLTSSTSASASRPIHTSDGTSRAFDVPIVQLNDGESTTPDVSNAPFDDTPFDPDEYERNDFESDSFADFPSVSIVEQSNESLPYSFDDSAPILSENFDDDPTAATVESPQPRFATLPPSPQSPHQPRLPLDLTKSPENMIDIDDALQVDEMVPMTREEIVNKRTEIRATSFSAARHSMHSGGGLKAGEQAFLPFHRRTESAPSSSAAFFERPQLSRLGSETADSASEKGFRMESVFEEEEEDEFEDSQEQHESQPSGQSSMLEQSAVGLGIDSAAPQDHFHGDATNKRSSVILSESSDGHSTPTPTNDGDIPSRSNTIRAPSSNRQSLVQSEPTIEELDNSFNTLQPPELIGGPDSRPGSFDLGNWPVSQPLPPINAPPWSQNQDVSSLGSASQEQSHSSAWSTPKLDTAATSVSDAPQLNVPMGHGDTHTTSSVSTDGIPSLISSNSTMSNFHNHTGSAGSPSTPSGTQSRHSYLSVGSQAERRRKRSSIASLSQLMSISRSGGARSNLSVQQDARCRTSSGLSNTASSEASTPGKEKRMKRLSRALKFWKPKAEGAPG